MEKIISIFTGLVNFVSKKFKSGESSEPSKVRRTFFRFIVRPVAWVLTLLLMVLIIPSLIYIMFLACALGAFSALYNFMFTKLMTTTEKAGIKDLFLVVWGTMWVSISCMVLYSVLGPIGALGVAVISLWPIYEEVKEHVSISKEGVNVDMDFGVLSTIFVSVSKSVSNVFTETEKEEVPEKDDEGNTKESKPEEGEDK